MLRILGSRLRKLFSGDRHDNTHALDAADMIDVGNDALADLAAHRRHQRGTAGRHVDDLARILIAVGQHEASKHVDFHTLKPPPLWLRQLACGALCVLDRRHCDVH